MERKTTVHAEDGKQDIVVTRQFDLPLELLFKAFTEPAIVEQWMGTTVLKLDTTRHGGWQFRTTDAQGNVVFEANGVFHEVVPNRKITRTFEMDTADFGAQLEFLEFDRLTDDTSRLTMHIIFRSAAHRDRMLRLPFAQGINMAHNRLQEIVGS